MSFIEMILVGVGLSMDAAAVCISNGMTFRSLTRRQKCSMPVVFGLFQGLMPLLGFFAGSLFSQLISRYAGITTLVILGIIGGKMIWDSFAPGQCDIEGVFTWKVLLLQGVATSIDAFAVGVSFCANGANIWVAAPIIAGTTFVCGVLALLLGRAVGPMLGPRAQLLGGIILVLLGVKALF